MMTKKYYAVVRTSYLKYKKRLMFPCMNSQLPIYWNRKVAKDVAAKFGKGLEVIEIEI